MYQIGEKFIAALGIAEMPALFGACFTDSMTEHEKTVYFI